MKKRGFTYIEVMIALAVFALIFTYVMKLNSSSNAVMRDEKQRLQMVYIAQREIERYKSEIFNDTDYTIDGFYVSVDRTDISSNDNNNNINKNKNKNKSNNSNNSYLIEVKITVKKNVNDSSDKAVVLTSHVFSK